MKASKINRHKRMIDKRIAAYVLALLVGASIMLYPTISNMWNDHFFKSSIATYESDVNKNKEIIEEEFEKAKEYNNNLSPKKVPDAFSIRDGITDKEYEDVLNISDNGMMGYISIPAIDIDIPIYHYTNEETLKKGAGHLLGSSLPVGGKGTHSVLSAHRGLPSAKLFSDLNLLDNGDNFYIHILGKTLKYEVDQVLVVEPNQTESLAMVAEKDYVTLVTCTPYGVNTQRLLVRGHRVANDGAASDDAKKRDYKRLLITILCVIAGVALAYVITKIIDRKRSRHETKRREKQIK